MFYYFLVSSRQFSKYIKINERRVSDPLIDVVVMIFCLFINFNIAVIGIDLYRYCRYYFELISLAVKLNSRSNIHPFWDTFFIAKSHHKYWLVRRILRYRLQSKYNNLIHSMAWHLISNLNDCRRRFRRVFIVISETYFERKKGGRTGYRLIQPSSKCAFIHSLYFRRTLKVITLNAET